MTFELFCQATPGATRHYIEDDLYLADYPKGNIGYNPASEVWGWSKWTTYAALPPQISMEFMSQAPSQDIINRLL